MKIIGKKHLMVLLAVLASCSSKKDGGEAKDSGNGDPSVEDVLDDKTVDMGMAGPKAKNSKRGGSDDDDLGGSGSGASAAGAEGGLIRFFDGGDKGLVAGQINWSKPLSSENPGADCELKARPKIGYACVVKQEKEAVILSIGVSNSLMNRISLDGRGKDTRDRWREEVLQAKYKLANEYQVGKSSKTVMVSLDKRTKAELIWVPAQNAVTLVFKPNSGDQSEATARRSGKNSRAKKAGK